MFGEDYGECWFREPHWANDLHERLLHFRGQHYSLGCHVIMPNHCHAVLRPFDGLELEALLQPMKRLTARHINESRGETGVLWQEESYDRITRDEEHLYRMIQYVGRNPTNAGIPYEMWHRWINPDWSAAGWDFEDLKVP